MQSAITSLIAVAGTLLGAIATYVFQARAARQARLEARAERLWQEQLVAYNAFANAITSYRGSQNARWHLRRKPDGKDAHAQARDASYAERVNAKSALFRLELVNPDPSLTRLAEITLQATTAIHNAPDESTRAELSEQAQATLRAFIEAASQQIRAASTDLSRSRRSPRRDLPPPG